MRWVVPVVLCLVVFGDPPAWGEPMAPVGGEWIVHFRGAGPDLAPLARAIRARRVAAVETIREDLVRQVAQAHLPVARLVEGVGGQIRTRWWLINAWLVEIPDSALASVRACSGVLRLERNRRWEPQIKVATGAGCHDADALQAKGLKGKGTAVAILDSGQDASCGSTGRPHRLYFPGGNPGAGGGGGIAGSRLLRNRAIGPAGAEDVNGHGTAVASIAAGCAWGPTAADDGHAPAAGIVGYGIAHGSSGTTTSATQVSAWQAVVADAAAYGITTANCSYGGDGDPLAAAQQALDRAVLVADLLVCTAAGNSANASGSQLCLNGLSVGAVDPVSRKVAGFSARGKVSGVPFPDLCANGVGTVMARLDAEGACTVQSGTSMASPQVCGAATLLRAGVPSLAADQVKAILLAGCRLIGGSGSTPVTTGEGCGTLHDADAWAIAGAGRRRGRGVVGAGGLRWHRWIRVTQGVPVRAAVAWHRQQVTSASWSDLDLEVWDGPRRLAASTLRRSTVERIRFVPAASGWVELRVQGVTLAVNQLSFGWAVTADATAARVEKHGVGCSGTAQAVVSGHVLPRDHGDRFGRDASWYGVGQGNLRYQQVFAGDELPAGVRLYGLGLRQDEGLLGQPGGTLDCTVLLGYTTRGVSTLGGVFAANFDTLRPAVTVFQGKLQLPAWSVLNDRADRFAVQVPFVKPWRYAPQTGENLLMEMRFTGTGQVAQYGDVAAGPGVRTSRVFALGVGATVGLVQPHYGLVVRFLTPGESVATPPRLNPVGLPLLGTPVPVRLDRVPAGAPILFLLGRDAPQWQGTPLPLDLAGLGAPGCALQVPPLVVRSSTADAAGRASLSLALPGAAALAGTPVALQVLAGDPPANPLGLVAGHRLVLIPGW